MAAFTRAVCALLYGSVALAGLVSKHAPYEGIGRIGVDPDYNRDVPQLITSKGYPAEVHAVQTEDGFVLGVQRIPAGQGKTGVNKVPVILMHGLLDSSAAWVINSNTESLAYILADAGYDVWLGNSRGNYYSRNHVKYTPDEKEFWAFSFAEMAQYDVPALVDYVLKTSNTSSVSWVGHSQGTCQVFAALSSQPSLNTKINLFAALAPVTYVANQKSIIFTALAQLHVDTLFQMFGIGEFAPASEWIHDIGKDVCGPYPDLCEDFIFLLCGTDTDPLHNLNATRMVDYLSHTPAGTSVQNMAHWAQLIRNKNYARYDYGSADENMKHYNSSTPPIYDLTQITAKVALFTGGQDALGDPLDLAKILTLLRADALAYHHDEPEYDHIDFTWGVDDHIKIYPLIIDLLQKFSPEDSSVLQITDPSTVLQLA